nr:hypothetical protein Iba_chr03cCG4760 [Ipomoea batatas]
MGFGGGSPTSMVISAWGRRPPVKFAEIEVAGGVGLLTRRGSSLRRWLLDPARVLVVALASGSGEVARCRDESGLMIFSKFLARFSRNREMGFRGEKATNPTHPAVDRETPSVNPTLLKCAACDATAIFTAVSRRRRYTRLSSTNPSAAAA